MTFNHKMIASALAELALAGSAIAAEPLRIGAMPLNTWWYVAGGAIANLVQSQASRRHHHRSAGARRRHRQSCVTNENKTQIAFSNVATADLGSGSGEEEIYKGKKHQDIRGLVGASTPSTSSRCCARTTSRKPATTRWKRRSPTRTYASS